MNDNSLFEHPGLYLRQTMDKGRGLFCDRAIEGGAAISKGVVMISSGDDARKMHETWAQDYTFKVEPSPAIRAWHNIPRDASVTGLAMGALSFCNHRAAPNARYAFSEAEKTVFYTLSAAEDIPAHTEICISYGNSWMAWRRLAAATGGNA